MPRRALAWFALYALALVAVYGRAAGYPFLRDDTFHLVSNPTVHAWEGLTRVFGTNYWEGYQSGGLYRPLLKSLWVLEVAGLGGSHAVVLAVSLLLHAVNATWIAALARRTGVATPIAGAAGLWFALHAAHTEVVVQGVGQGESLCLLFSLAAVTVAMRGESRDGGRLGGRIALLALLCFAALLTKEHALAMVAVVSVAVACVDGHALRGKLAAGGALLAVVALAIALRVAVVGSFGPEGSAQILGDLTTGERALDAPYLLGRYALLALAPVRLSADYDWLALELPPSLGDPRLLLGLAIVLAAVVFGLRRARGERAALVPLAAAVLPLLPFLGLIPIGTLFAERHAYLALAGAAWGLAWIGDAVGRRRSVPGTVAILCTWAIALGVRAAVRVPVWSDSLHLWETTARDCPKSFVAASHAGWLRMEAGDNVGARRYAEQALSVAPGWDAAHIVLGNVDLMESRFASARAHFAAAHRQGRYELGARVGQAFADLALGNRDEALREYEALRAEAPDDERVRNLGRALE